MMLSIAACGDATVDQPIAQPETIETPETPEPNEDVNNGTRNIDAYLIDMIEMLDEVGNLTEAQVFEIFNWVVEEIKQNGFVDRGAVFDRVGMRASKNFFEYVFNVSEVYLFYIGYSGQEGDEDRIISTRITVSGNGWGALPYNLRGPLNHSVTTPGSHYQVLNNLREEWRAGGEEFNVEVIEEVIGRPGILVKYQTRKDSPVIDETFVWLNEDGRALEVNSRINDGNQEHVLLTWHRR